MNNGQNQLQINDIKTIVQIPDYSIYIYYGLIILIIGFVVAFLYFIYNYFKSKRFSKEKEYFAILKSVDFSKEKQTAYDISKYGRLLIKDERQQRLFEELYQSLEEFKYKKNIDKKIPNTIKLQHETFLESLDV
jgi:cbb3-type cytochrome oxidase subunit 3